MNQPRVIHLLTQRIRVQRVSNLRIPTEHAEHAVTDGAAITHGMISLNGLADLDGGRIFIDADTAPDKARETLLHESLHFVNSMAGLKIKYDPAEEEALVKVVAPILLSLLRENPNLVEYLTRRD